MTPIDLLNSPVARALGWTLLHALWQGFALVLPIAVGLHLLQNRSSALRYRVSVLTLLAQLLVSALTFVWYYQPTAGVAASPATVATVRSMPVSWQSVAQTLPWHLQLQQFLDSHLSQFVLIYLVGVALFGLRLAGGWLYLQHLSHTATQPAQAIWKDCTEQLRAVLKIRAVVQVRESARVTVPMVVGMFKPVLLVPIGLATGLSNREIEAILAHELAHIKRYDYAVNLLQSVMEVLYFFHPALWWLSARVREEREHCCDDLAVRACGGDGRALAGALARVEERRLAQVSTPALAMAFASRRQQLLHRVRRVLGVSSQPVSSNSSLAGLTLATILLVSASVYAVQQPKPRPTTAHHQTTRKHKLGKGTEVGLSEDRKVTYVVWKGQKLPANRVARLQRQLDLVEAGQLSLDEVSPSDRDILLTIIESNKGFETGMASLANGLAHIDYDNIVRSAMNNVSIDQQAIVAGVADIDYQVIVDKALATVSPLLLSSDSLNRQRAYHQRQMDSLSQLLAQQSRQAQALRLQMEKLRFPVEEVQRQNEVLNWRKNKLMEQRNSLLEKHQSLLYNTGKQKLNQVEVEKQLATLEPEIKKLESSMEALNRQMEQANAKQEELQKPMEQLEREAEKIEEQVSKLSEQIGEHGNRIALSLPEPPDAPEVPEPDGVRHPRPARPPRPPRALRGNIGGVAPAAPVPPAPPVVPPGPPPAIKSTPKAAPTPKPTPMPMPQPTPRPAPTPKPDR